MELWSIECVVVIGAILQGATSVGVINAEQCVSPHNNSNFAGSFEAHGYAHLFRANSNLVSNNGKVCVAFSSIRNGNIWNITMNYGAEAGDKISGLLAGFGQFSTFGLRDSEVIFIEACNETARFGFEESGGPAEICFNYEDIISFNRSVSISVQVAFQMAALDEDIFSSWNDGFRMFGPSMIRSYPKKNRRKSNRIDNGMKSSFGPGFGLWSFCTVLILVEFYNWNIS